MYREHDRQQVHAMRKKGYSKGAIARTLGMSRNTVDKLLGLHELPVFARKDALTKREELAIDNRARARLNRVRHAQESEVSNAELSTTADQKAFTAQNYIVVTSWRSGEEVRTTLKS